MRILQATSGPGSDQYRNRRYRIFKRSGMAGFERYSGRATPQLRSTALRPLAASGQPAVAWPMAPNPVALCWVCLPSGDWAASGKLNRLWWRAGGAKHWLLDGTRPGYAGAGARSRLV